MKLTAKDSLCDFMVELGNVTFNEALKELTSDMGKDKDKPELKKIDMSVCIESGIDCEFSFDFDVAVSIGKLAKISDNGYEDTQVDYFDYCRPRMNHIHACPDGFDKCPLPEGFLIKAYYIGSPTQNGLKQLSVVSGYKTYIWTNVIAFEVTGIAEGYEL